MLRINAIPNSAAAKRYYDSPDYYLEGKEAPARWHGKGADLLGLSGEVNEADFAALCDNQFRGKQLTAKTAINRRVGYDFTFSVPKSLSVLYSLGGDHRLADAFQEAVAETMAEAEREMYARVRRKGADFDRHTGNMLWAGFLHHTSRPIDGQPDPQLHIHAVVFNATYDHEEHQWKAGEFSRIKKDAPYHQAAFRARLAEKVQRLGYEVERKRDDFEVVGVPPRINKEFSRRTDLIEKTANLLGIKRPETKAKLGATTRSPKLKDGMTWFELVSKWKERVSRPEMKAVESVASSATLPIAPEERAHEAVAFALDHLLERKSVVDQRSVMTEALKFGLGSVTPESVAEEIAARRDLIRRQVGDRTMVSTQGVLSEEKRLVAFATQGRGRCRPLRGFTAHAEADRRDLATLSPSQQGAVRHAWESPDRLILIRGAAGTGKTTLTRAALEGVSVPWVILAPTAEASRGVLKREGFHNADTLAAFLGSKEMQSKVSNGLIWLDEASLVGAHDMAKLVELAGSLNARIVLSGDRRQHKSVSRGDVLGLLEDRAGCPVAEVGEIRRQTGEYREAVKLLAAGRVEIAFDKLDGMGWVKQGGLVDDYLKAVDENRSVLIVAPTHAEGKAITAELRGRLKEAGKLSPVEHEFDTLVNLNLTAAELAEAKKERPEGVVVSRYGAYRPEKIGLAAGDTIRMTANGKDITREHRVNNGAVYTVAGFTPAGHIKLDNGWTLDKDFRHFTHGYAVTSHAAQGRTVDQVLVAMPASTFPAVGKEAAYVSVSRGRQRARIYTDEKEDLREQWAKEDNRMLATDLVREPKHGVRRKLQKFISWLRREAVRGKELVTTHEQERTASYGR